MVRPSGVTSFSGSEYLNNPDKAQAQVVIGTPVLVSEEKTWVFRGSQFSLKNARPEDLIADRDHSYDERSNGMWLESVVQITCMV